MLLGLGFSELKYAPCLVVLDGTVIDANYSFLDFTGYLKGEVLNRNFQEVIQKLLKINSDLEKLEDGKSENLFMFTRSLAPRDVEISARKLFKGCKAFVFHEKPESRLEDKLSVMERLYGDSPIGTAVFNAADQAMLKANDKFFEFLNAPYNRAENSMGLSMGLIMEGWDKRRIDHTWKALVNTSCVQLERQVLFRKSDGASKYADLMLIPITEENSIKLVILNVLGSKEHAAGNGGNGEGNRDSARNMELEEALRVRDEFLTIISHEFRTPLTVISSVIQTMEKVHGSELSDGLKKYLEKIKQSTYRQIKLVNNLLEAKKIETGQLDVNCENADVVMLTREIVDSIGPYARRKGINLEFSSSRASKIIAVDEEKYRRILLNLLSNAVKFAPPKTMVYVALESGDNEVVVEIKDHGIGIPEEKRERIFEPFFQADGSLTRAVEGAGIGLFLTKKLAESMGGRVEVNSTEGIGSTFKVVLPARIIEDEKEALKSYNLSDIKQSVAIEFSDVL